MRNLLENKSFFIETYGCSSNKADSNIMRDILKKSEYEEKTFNEATFIIINTCAVKEQTENKIKARLKDLNKLTLKNQNKRIIIGGCLPQINDNYLEKIKKIIPNYAAIIDLNTIFDISDILDEILEGKKNLVVLKKAHLDKAMHLVDYSEGKVTGIVPISEGCLGSCTYCCVKNARGRLRCYNPNNILLNVEHQLSQGIKQIYFTSQDCSIYQYNDIGLFDILKEINSIDKDFFLRVGMINPRLLINDIDQIIKILKLQKVYQFLHIPIQSGSDDVLKRMKRPYLISEIINKINDLRDKFPYLTISTDIICGFPGESEYDFYKTINFIKWLKPEILNISKFTARPGTIAKNMEQLDSKLIKERSIRLTNLFKNSLKTLNLKWKDWEGRVLLLHRTKNKNQVFGRNHAYKNIFLDDQNAKVGDFVNVKIHEIKGFNLFGKIIEK
ncbi:MAG: tRNA (N(6)-L-threonylcarbamoyladenosine(37)-C(2))-methylthiotransferase [Candidatus Lokiarchaeota archaeon]|nr:tRNA (N(6)-L-threonylcarbamoyladenosine(37)-C(2))-methylthiotransferase [Candidatus Lokiarchaeota archaeon]MBD3201757.1 tRNA (N(6)-L-threonylcarbamoyladenosine(37)-C(2))-methylthiotransferase [Candidatus Lokiarchaeota archaeon]